MTLLATGFRCGQSVASGSVAPAELTGAGAQCPWSVVQDALGGVKLDYSAATANAQGDLMLHGRGSTSNVHRYMSFLLRVTYDAGGEYTDPMWVAAFSDGTTHLGIQVVVDVGDTTKFSIFVTDGTSTTAVCNASLITIFFDVGTDYVLTMYWQDEDVGGGEGHVEIKIDGVDQYIQVGLDGNNAMFLKSITVDRIRVGGILGKDITEVTIPYLTRLWFNDGATADPYSSWPPYPLPQQKLALPNAEGQYAEWAKKAGIAGTGVYTEWDDGVSNDADGTYNESLVAAADVDQLSNLQSAADIGLSPMWPILAVVTKALAKVTAGTTGAPAVLVRDDGTDYTTAMTPGANYLLGTLDRIDGKMPNGGATWTHARVAAFQAGMQRLSGDRNVRCTALYPVVIYQVLAPHVQGHVI